MIDHVTDLTGSWTPALAADDLMRALLEARERGETTLFTSDGKNVAVLGPSGIRKREHAADPGWNGWRLTLNCAHLLLTDQDDWHIGKLVPCDMDRPTRQMRVIVDRQPVHAPAAPELLTSAYWYGT